jgi:tetratricopeptide (TPR) repeat protein
VKFDTLVGDIGDLYRSERYFRILLNDLPSDHPDLGTVLNNLGIIAHKQDQHVKAIEFFQRALQVLPEGHGDQACAYTNQGASYQALGADDKALNAYEKALEVILFPSDKAKIYNNMGSIYRHRRQFDTSIKYHQLSLNLKSPNDPELVATYMNLALVYADIQDYNNSLMFCEKSLDAIKILPTDSIQIGMTYFNFGYITAQMEQHSEAIKHFSDALNAYRRMTPSFVVTEAITKTLYELGRSYMELDQNTLALDCFNEVLSVVSTDNDLQTNAALVHHSIGQIHETEEAFSYALESYHRALNIWMTLLKAKSNVDRQVIAQLLNNIAEVHDKTKRYAFALWYYAQAIKFAEENTELVQEYKESFQAVAERAMDIFRKILNVHVIELE